jgi:hypothetical protein
MNGRSGRGNWTGSMRGSLRPLPHHFNSMSRTELAATSPGFQYVYLWVKVVYSLAIRKTYFDIEMVQLWLFGAASGILGIYRTNV